jgi:RNA polymerase sigma-70 factor (ECF subfamily)
MSAITANLRLAAVTPARTIIMQGETGHAQPDALEQLIRRAQGGDASAFGHLYEHFYDKIFRYVMFKTGDRIDAEDITTDVFLRMLESIGSFKFQGYPFSSWLFRIAHNLIVDHFRRRARRQTAPLDDAMAVAGGSSGDMDHKIDIDLSVAEVYEAMDDLTDLQREVMSLRFAAGLSVKETAEAVGRKENAVKALQHAAVKKLRAALNVSAKGAFEPASPRVRNQ